MIDPTWIQAGSAVLSAAAGKPSAPSTAISSATSLTNSWFDGSGWTVATSGGSARGGDRLQSDSPAGMLANAAADSVIPILVAGALVALLVWTRRKA